MSERFNPAFRPYRWALALTVKHKIMQHNDIFLPITEGKEKVPHEPGL